LEIILDLIESESLYPIWWLFFSWVIWLLLRWRNWPRPRLSVMLIYSAAIIIFFIRDWQGYISAFKVELVIISFSLVRFLAGVSFWSIILYVPVALTLKPKIIFDPRRYWWIALLVLAFPVWYLAHQSPALIGYFIYFDMITTDIFFYTLLGFFVPWFIWLLLGRIERPRPSVPIMILYSISAAIVFARLWDEAYVCKMVSWCEFDFSLPLFMVEVALWFIPLFVLLKLISRVESGNKFVELAEKHKGQPIGTE
jgi:hypothetical protein